MYALLDIAVADYGSITINNLYFFDCIPLMLATQ